MKFTIRDFRNRFPDDNACLKEVMRLRYSTLQKCPDCDKPAKFHRVNKRRCFECQWCGYQIYPTQGTVFEKTTTPLHMWFYAIYLMTATRSGVSAKEIERQLGVTYKTAWRMAHQIRKLMGGNDGKLDGIIEADETYIGGKRSGKRGRGAEGKTPVVGVLQRDGGGIRAKAAEDVKAKTVIPNIVENVEKGSMICTDELGSYNRLEKEGYCHVRVNHAAGEYVYGLAHTNSIEGFWSHLKLSIRGTHVWVSKKHLQKYVDEFAFRFNTREFPGQMFDSVLQRLSTAHS
jgi:transposase